MPGGEDNIECRLEMFKVLLSSGDENCTTKFTSHRCVSPKCDVKCVLEIRHESYFIFTICLSRSDFPIKCVRKRERERDVEYVCMFVCVKDVHGKYLGDEMDTHRRRHVCSH